MKLILAVDQGTSGTSAALYDLQGRVVGGASVPVATRYPQPGWVEQDPHEILASVRQAVQLTIASAGAQPGQIVCMGMAHQGESLLVWDRVTGAPVYNVISWQCARSADVCHRLELQGVGPDFRRRTGLPLDPTWPSTKVAWVLEHIALEARTPPNGRLAYSQLDAWLMHHLTLERPFRTDHAMAARSGFYNLQTRAWDDDLVNLFGGAGLDLPEIVDNEANFGTADFGNGWCIPWCGNILDQAAALLGQGCNEPGDTKVTYGTCAGIWHNLGAEAHRTASLETSIAWVIRGTPCFALVGETTVAGAALAWLRQQLRAPWIDAELAAVAQAAGTDDELTFVPAFSGLGSPHSAPDVRGTLYGLTAATGLPQLLRAALQSIAFSVCDVVAALPTANDPEVSRALKVDGGLTHNEYLMQFQADMLGQTLLVPRDREATARGAALLAGQAAGYLASPQAWQANWQVEHTYTPQMPAGERQQRYTRWQTAIEHTLGAYDGFRQDLALESN